MIGSWYFGYDFWMGIIWLLVLSAGAALVITGFLRVLSFVMPDRGADGDNRGCLVVILCILSILILGNWLMYHADDMQSSVPRELRLVHPMLQKHSNVMVDYVSRSHPNLADNYGDLFRLHASMEESLRALREEMQTMSTEGGRRAFEKGIREKEADLRRVERMIAATEHVAGCAYFAEMLLYLGEKVNSSSLEEQMARLVSESNQALSRTAE